MGFDIVIQKRDLDGKVGERYVCDWLDLVEDCGLNVVRHFKELKIPGVGDIRQKLNLCIFEEVKSMFCRGNERRVERTFYRQ